MSTIETRLGDGSMVEMSERELMEDMVAGSEDAASRAEVPPLNKEDYQYLVDLFKQPDRFVGVRPGPLQSGLKNARFRFWPDGVRVRWPSLHSPAGFGVEPQDYHWRRNSRPHQETPLRNWPKG